MPKIKICLDAGHSGKYNQSPANKAYYESDMSWKLHLLLKKYLESYGMEVITTRKTQSQELSVTNRGKKAKGCDLFISLHSNAYPNGSVNEETDYPIVYVPLSGKGDDIGKSLVECIAKTMCTRQTGKCTSKKGANGDYYGVIRGAESVGTTGLLIEHSFHTNTRSTNWLLNDDNLNALAKAEADVIAKYFALTQSSKLYRVQVGAFSQKDGAEQLLSNLNEAGFSGFITSN
ncbi:MAG: N-acetylmuramoyl-L-alanine amidase [Oscillospiraceae bacterium]|nr:N-acetylmuramoyl-L-alanine amidase [Oscillospiraceae bacterium]